MFDIQNAWNILPLHWMTLKMNKKLFFFSNEWYTNAHNRIEFNNIRNWDTSIFQQFTFNVTKR